MSRRLREIAEHSHRPRTPPCDHPQLHWREVLCLVDNNMRVCLRRLCFDRSGQMIKQGEIRHGPSFVRHSFLGLPVQKPDFLGREFRTSCLKQLNPGAQKGRQETLGGHIWPDAVESGVDEAILDRIFGQM